jgi:hypothetical protein
VVLFLAAWLVGWCFGLVMAARALFLEPVDAPTLFLAAWLIGWTLAGGFALYVWLWTLAGREVLVLRPDSLVMKRDLRGLGRLKEYDLLHVKNLRVSPVPWNLYSWSGGMQFWGVGGGPVAFDYGSRTIRFGSGLDEAEARGIVKELRARHAFPDATD